jgi:hypothetical protein
MQPIHALLNKPAAPFANSSLGNPQASRNVLVLQTLGAFQNDPRPHGQRLRRLAPRRKQLQFRPLSLAENQLRHPSTHLRSSLLPTTYLLQQCESVMTRTSESGH